MKVLVEDVTGLEYTQRAMRRCGATFEHTPRSLYERRHSPIYARIFWADILGVTNRVHTHLVRHHEGIVWFVATQRPDRGGQPGLRDISVMFNAMAAITLGQKRLCMQAWDDTRDAVVALREGIRQHDPALARLMQPLCVWERHCTQSSTCGWYERQVLDDDGVPVELC